MGLWAEEWLARGPRLGGAARPRAEAPAPEAPAPENERLAAGRVVARKTARRRSWCAAAALLVGGGVVGADLTGSDPASRPAAAAPLPACGRRSGVECGRGRVYASVADGVVAVQVGGGSGTGFVIDERGTIVTNAHVVGESSQASVRFGDSGATIDAEVLGSDPSTDLAVLRVDPSRVGTLSPLKFADSDAVRVGDEVVAIGHPFGLDRTATAGIVSGLGREIQSPNGFSIDEVIQTDAAINRGTRVAHSWTEGARGRRDSQIATAGGAAATSGWIRRAGEHRPGGRAAAGERADDRAPIPRREHRRGREGVEVRRSPRADRPSAPECAQATSSALWTAARSPSPTTSPTRWTASSRRLGDGRGGARRPKPAIRDHPRQATGNPVGRS